MPGHALFIDCRSLEVRHVPVPDGLRVLVVDSVVASRMTGAGFGGCTGSLVEADAASAAAAHVADAYAARTGRTPRWWVSRSAAGAMELLERRGTPG